MKKLGFLGMAFLCAGFMTSCISISRTRPSYLPEQIAYYTEALEKNPQDASAYFERGRYYMWNGKADEAVTDYTAALGIQPHFPEAYYYRGEVHYTNGRYEQAAEDFSKASEQDPSNQDYRDALQAAKTAKAGG